jgi:hypothetical protein
MNKALMAITIMALTGCASLKPIESTQQEIPSELSAELQSKFKVQDEKPQPSKPAPVKVAAKGKNKTAALVPAAEAASTPVVKKFNPPPGQKIIFAVYAPMGIRAGTLIAKVDGYKTINNQEVILLKANIYNTAFFASIFTVNLLIESYVDPVDFKSVRYQVTGQEGKLNKKTLELYDYEKNNIVEYKSVVENGEKKTSQNTHNVLTGETAQDLLSAFWKVVSLDFTNKTEHTFLVATGNSVKNAKVVKLSDYEDGWVLGLSVDPSQNPNDRKIYLNTKTKLVDKIEANIKWGSFKVLRVDKE